MGIKVKIKNDITKKNNKNIKIVIKYKPKLNRNRIK